MNWKFIDKTKRNQLQYQSDADKYNPTPYELKQLITAEQRRKIESQSHKRPRSKYSNDTNRTAVTAPRLNVQSNSTATATAVDNTVNPISLLSTIHQSDQFPPSLYPIGHEFNSITPLIATDIRTSRSIQVFQYPVLVPARTGDWGWNLTNQFVQFSSLAEWESDTIDSDSDSSTDSDLDSHNRVESELIELEQLGNEFNQQLMQQRDRVIRRRMRRARNHRSEAAARDAQNQVEQRHAAVAGTGLLDESDSDTELHWSGSDSDADMDSARLLANTNQQLRHQDYEYYPLNNNNSNSNPTTAATAAAAVTASTAEFELDSDSEDLINQILQSNWQQSSTAESALESQSQSQSVNNNTNSQSSNRSNRSNSDSNSNSNSDSSDSKSQ